MMSNYPKGFSMAETLVVLGCLSLILTATATSMFTWMPSHQMDTALAKASEAVAAARSKAIIAATDTVLEVDTATGRYSILPDTVHNTTNMIVIDTLPKELRFACPPGFSPVPAGMNQTFNSKGILKNDSSTRYIYIAHPRKGIYKRLRVSASGNTAIETWNGSSWS